MTLKDWKQIKPIERGVKLFVDKKRDEYVTHRVGIFRNRTIIGKPIRYDTHLFKGEQTMNLGYANTKTEAMDHAKKYMRSH